MRLFASLIALSSLALLAGCALRPKTTATAQIPEPRVTTVPPAPGEAERIGAGGDEFNYRMNDWSKEGHYQEIITAARLRLKNEPSHIGARYALAHALYYNGDFAGAAVEAQELVESPQYQSDAQANELLSNAKLLAKRYPTQAPVNWMQNDVDAAYDKWRGHAVALLDAEQYDEIERTAAALTAKPEMMSDGSWTLAPFFVGLWTGNDDSEASWPQSHARVEKWAAARPQSQLAQVCLARSWTNGAWLARGDEFADKVSDATWKTVKERQDNAAPIIRKMLNAPRAFSPLVYAAAQRYGRLGGAPRDWHDKVYQRGIAQYPNYADFHRERAIYLLPRWDGGRGEWESEAASAADAQPNAAAGDALYARIVWGQWTWHTNMKQQTNIDWPRTKRGFDAILKQYPGSLAAATIYLRLCHQWNDYAQARQVLQVIAGRADAGSWPSRARFAQTRNFLLKAA